MSMTTVLLLIILILLVAVLVLMFTVWPARQRVEIEKAVSGLRREMAEHQGNSVRLIQTIRNDVEDAVQESLEREMGDFMRSGAHAPAPLRRSVVMQSSAGQDEVSSGFSANASDTPLSAWTGVSLEEEAEAQRQSRQLSLFMSQPALPASSASPHPVSEVSVPVSVVTSAEEMEKVHAVLHDDIPDMGDLPDIDDPD
uniref:Uncharacterized protein n=1 Tax=Chlorobium phaeobacteroides (strain BS1) TaxID=331678 RepID=B3EQT6_CHLPB